MATILCFGDSITQGFVDPEGGLDPAAATPARPGGHRPLGDITFPAHAVFNLGISDDTTAGLAERLSGS
jgi:lysophospholipase L1-like esterase